ncbi:hypothetical protein IMSAGC011_00095 [Lachnospiraceae bacterium]|nr:hypothetical protein IMSAGC011_00095 [Lachnospiraceae bacterium]
MEDNDYVLAFDHFYTTNHIQILKSLLPFMGNDNFRMLPALIKYMEFQYTMSLLGKGSSNYSNGIHASSIDTGVKPTANIDPAENLENIYKAVHKYLAPSEEQSFNQILSAMKTMKNIKEMQQMMELIQSLNPDLGNSMDLGNLMESLSPGNDNTGAFNLNEIMEMMKMFGGNDNGIK